MTIHHFIPAEISSDDRQAILERIRRDQADIEDVMADARTSGVVPLSGWRWLIGRMRSLNAMEQAWMEVQLDGMVN